MVDRCGTKVTATSFRSRRITAIVKIKLATALYSNVYLTVAMARWGKFELLVKDEFDLR